MQTITLRGFTTVQQDIVNAVKIDSVLLCVFSIDKNNLKSKYLLFKHLFVFAANVCLSMWSVFRLRFRSVRLSDRVAKNTKLDICVNNFGNEILP